jgi:hypothetical protein
MPRILELRQIDGELWARLDYKFKEGDGGISLYTAAELKTHVALSVRNLFEKIEDLRIECLK